MCSSWTKRYLWRGTVVLLREIWRCEYDCFAFLVRSCAMISLNWGGVCCADVNECWKWWCYETCCVYECFSLYNLRGFSTSVLSLCNVCTTLIVTLEYVYVCMCVCVYVCMYVCVYVGPPVVAAFVLHNTPFPTSVPHQPRLHSCEATKAQVEDHSPWQVLERAAHSSQGHTQVCIHVDRQTAWYILLFGNPLLVSQSYCITLWACNGSILCTTVYGPHCVPIA